MAYQTITVTLPEQIYRRIERRSRLQKRTVADEAAAAIASSFSETSELPADLQHELSQLRWLSDEALWQAAQLTATEQETERMQLLVEKQQRLGLTSVEQEEAELLSKFFTRVMLVRAEAAVLLKNRGADISTLAPQLN
jgi:hypothetical protein